MSTTISGGIDSPPEQVPWRDSKDREGWQVVARGDGRPRELAISIMVDLDAEQSAWLREEAEQARRDYDDIILELIDAARLSGAAAQNGATSAAPVGRGPLPDTE